MTDERTSNSGQLRFVRLPDHHGRSTVTVAGEIDIATEPELRDVLAAMTAESPGDVGLDCAELEFLDSSGLRVLAHAARQLNADGRRLILINLAEPFRRLLEITGVDACVVIESEEELSPQ